MAHVATKTTTNQFVEDLVRDEDDESTAQDDPAKGEDDEGDHVEEAVAVVHSLGVLELDHVDRVIVSKGSPEVVETFLPQQGVQCVRPHPMPEDPPGDGDHPHDDADHEHDVVHEVTPELAEAASHVITTRLIIFETAEAFNDEDPEKEKDPDSSAPKYQHPRHIRFSSTVWILISGSCSLESADYDHEEQEREAEDIEDPYAPDLPLLPVRQESLAPLPTSSTLQRHPWAAPPPPLPQYPRQIVAQLGE